MARANVPHVISDDSALGGQLISGSLRFRSASNTILKRTHSSVGNKRTFTFSCWCKRSLIGSTHNFLISSSGNGEFFKFGFRDDSRFEINTTYSGSDSAQLISTAKFRDRSAWYHIVVAFDTTQGTSTNRVKFYVNNTLITQYDLGTYPSQNDESSVNDNVLHEIGNQTGTTRYFDGYMTEVNLIDGQQLEPTAFGYTDSQTGIWRPKKYTGTFGTNGFNLPMNGFSHVGEDKSGNGNHFIPNDCGTVPIDRATGAFPIMNTNNGATVPLPGFRPDPFASNLVLASTFSDPSDILDVHHLIKGSGSEKGLFVTGTTKDTSQHNFYGRAGSLYFDGNTDYINLTATSDFNFGTGDFTIEFWMYSGVNSVDSFYRRLWMTDGPTGNASGNFQISITPTSGVINLWEDSSALDVSGVSNVTTSTWNHIAAVRSGSTLKLYVNGREEVSTTYTTAISPNSGSPRPRIGNYGAGGGEGDYNGYLQDLRVYKGVAKYTEEFLCGAVDSSITEHSPSGIAVPRTLDSHTGGSVALHTTANVSPDIIVASNSDLYLDGDFTIEFWIYLNSITSDTHNPSIITFPDNSGIGQVYINASNKFYSLWWPNTDIVSTPYKSAKVGRWQYITITRSSNSCRIFIDGVLQDTSTSSQAFGNSYGGLRIGGYTQNTGNVDGHISNLRIIKGTALYTSSFTPPTEPLTNVTGTSLLCFQSPNDVEAFTVDKNASTLNNKNWTRSGTFTWSIGADSSVTSKHRQFDGTIETGSAGAPNGNPGNVRFTFDTPVTGITKCRLRTNTHNDPYQYRRTYYNGANGTYSIQTSTNTTAWHDVTSNVGNTLNWVEFGSYGGSDTDRGPYGCNGIEINDVLLTDRFRDDDGHGAKSSASHFSPFDNDIIQEGPSQYATLNPNAQTGVTLSNGNLTNTGGNDIPSNMGVKTGKFYAEVSIDTANSGSNLKHLGICATGRRAFRSVNNNNHILDNLDTVTIRSDANGPYTSTGRGGITSWTQVFNDTNIGFTIGDTVGIQLDMDNKFVKFYINGSLRVHYTFVLASTFDKMHFYGRNNGSGKTSWNFGQKPYEFTPPSGFLPLASHNLESASILKPQKHFEALLWTGNGGTSQTVTGLQFKPDFVWIKGTNAAWNRLQNSVTGANKLMYTNSQNAEATNEANGYVSSFTNDGFILADPDGNGGGVNTNGDVYVAWCWKAGGDSNTFNIDGVGYATAAAAGLDGGTANPTGASVNTKAGFSIISYTATQNQNVSYSHGLNQAPEIIITKDRDNSRSWGVYYSVDGTNTNWMTLNNSNAQGSNNSGVTPVGGSSGTFMYLHQDYFAPSYNSFANGGNDGDDRIISYMWHSVPGYSKIGMYRGNGNSNGPYIDCGFRPAFIMTKSTSNGSYWWEMVDNKRSPTNPSQRALYANKNDAEYSGSGYDKDIYANGFKPRSGNGGHNDNLETYLFMAFAEQPEVTPFGSQSNAR